MNESQIKIARGKQQKFKKMRKRARERESTRKAVLGGGLASLAAGTAITTAILPLAGATPQNQPPTNTNHLNTTNDICPATPAHQNPLVTHTPSITSSPNHPATITPIKVIDNTNHKKTFIDLIPVTESTNDFVERCRQKILEKNLQSERASRKEISPPERKGTWKSDSAEFLHALIENPELILDADRNNILLYGAIEQNDLAFVQNLIHLGCDVNKKGMYNISPVNAALIYKHFDIAHALIKSGAKIAQNYENSIVLFNAIDNDDPELLKALIENGWGINSRIHGKITPLVAACLGGKTAIVKILLEAGAKVALPAEQNRADALFAAINTVEITPIQKEDKLSITEMLLTHGANPDKVYLDKTASTPLEVAFVTEQYELVELLISRGANPEVKNKNGKLLSDLMRDHADKRYGQLLDALKYGKYETAAALIKTGAKITQTDDNNHLLFSAITNNDFKLLQALVMNNKWSVLVKKDKETPLSLAFKSNQYNMVELLLSHGAYQFLPTDIDPTLDEIMKSSDMKYKELGIKYLFKSIKEDKKIIAQLETTSNILLTIFFFLIVAFIWASLKIYNLFTEINIQKNKFVQKNKLVQKISRESKKQTPEETAKTAELPKKNQKQALAKPIEKSIQENPSELLEKIKKLLTSAKQEVQEYNLNLHQKQLATEKYINHNKISDRMNNRPDIDLNKIEQKITELTSRIEEINLSLENSTSEINLIIKDIQDTHHKLQDILQNCIFLTKTIESDYQTFQHWLVRYKENGKKEKKEVQANKSSSSSSSSQQVKEKKEEKIQAISTQTPFTAPKVAQTETKSTEIVIVKNNPNTTNPISTNPHLFLAPKIDPEKAKETAIASYLAFSAQLGDLSKEDMESPSFTLSDIDKLSLSYFLFRTINALLEMCKSEQRDFLVSRFRPLRNRLVKCILMPEISSKKFIKFCKDIKSEFENVHAAYKETKIIDLGLLTKFSLTVTQHKFNADLNIAWTNYQQDQDPNEDALEDNIKDLIKYLKKIQDILKVIPQGDVPCLTKQPHLIASSKALMMETCQIYRDSVKDSGILNGFTTPEDRDDLANFFTKLGSERDLMAHNATNFHDIPVSDILKLTYRSEKVILILESIAQNLKADEISYSSSSSSSSNSFSSTY